MKKRVLLIVSVLAVLALIIAIIAWYFVEQSGPRILARANLALQANQADKAQDLATRYIAKYPADWQGHHIQARAYLQQGKFQAARNAFEQALKLSPAQGAALVGLSDTYAIPVRDFLQSRDAPRNLARLQSAVTDLLKANEVLAGVPTENTPLLLEAWQHEGLNLMRIAGIKKLQASQARIQADRAASQPSGQELATVNPQVLRLQEEASQASHEAALKLLEVVRKDPLCEQAAVSVLQICIDKGDEAMIVQAELAIMATPTPCPVPVTMLVMHNLQKQMAGADEARRNEVLAAASHSLDGLLERHPHNAQVLLARCELALDANHLDEADKLCHEVLKTDQAQPNAELLEARILLARGEATPACEKLFEFVSQHPHWIEGHLLYARAALAAGRHEPAIAALREIVGNLDPGNAVALRMLVENSLREGYPQVALEDAQHYYRLHHDDPAAIRLYAEAARQIGRVDLARTAFEKALAENAGTETVLTAAEGLALLGDEAAAAAAASKIPTTQPTSGAGRMTRIRAMLLTHHYTEAQELLAAELAANPNNAAAHFEMGRLCVMTSRLQEAVHHYRQAAQLEPRTSRYSLAWAQALLDSGDLTACEKALASVEAVTPSITLMKLRIRLLRGEPLSSQELAQTPQEGQGTLVQALAYLTVGQAARSADICLADLKKNPDNPEALALLAEAYMVLGQKPQAVTQLESLVRLAPDDVSAYYRLAGVLMQDSNEAIIRRELSSVPQAKKPLVDLAIAWVQQRLGEHARAASTAGAVAVDSAVSPDTQGRARLICSDSLASLARYEEALKVLEPLNAQPAWFTAATLGAARIYKAAGRNDDALAALDKVMAKARETTDSMTLARAIELLASLNVDKALAACTAMAQLTPNDDRPLLLQADVLTLAGRRKETVDLYRAALRKNPANHQVHLALAQTLDSLARPQEALDALSDLAKLGTSAAALALYERASMLARWGLPQQALESLAALEKIGFNGNPAVLLAMGEGFGALGQTDKARETLAGISKDSPQHAASLMLLANLATTTEAKLAALSSLYTAKGIAPAVLAQRMAVLMQAGRAGEAVAAFDSAYKDNALPVYPPAANLAFEAMLETTDTAAAATLAVRMARQTHVVLWQRLAALLTLDQASPEFPDPVPDDAPMALLQMIQKPAAPRAQRAYDLLKANAQQSSAIAQYRVLVSLAAGDLARAEADIAALHPPLDALRESFTAAVAQCRSNADTGAADATALMRASLAMDFGATTLARTWAVDLLRARPTCLWAANLAVRNRTDANACAAVLELLSSTDSATADNIRGMILMLGRQYTQAAAAYRAGLDRHKDNADLQAGLAAALEQLGQDHEAYDLYAQLWQSTGSIPAANNAAYLAAQLWPAVKARLEQADAWTQAAVAAAPRPQYRDTHGLLLLLQGKPQEAAEELHVAMAAMPDSPEVHYHLALAELALGHKELATWHFAAAVELGRKLTAPDELTPHAAAAVAGAQAQLAKMK